MIIKYIKEKQQKLNIKNVDVNNFSNLSQIYSFTTENIAGYFEQINLIDKDILTVSASGDHIINSFYKGAKNVIGFDINYLALIYTELKLIAVQNLEYKEFLEFFMINKENDIEKNRKVLDYGIYKNKIRKSLSSNTAKYWDYIYKDFNNNGYELRNSYIFNNKYDNNTLKLNSNLYLKSEFDYNMTRKQMKDKEVTLIHSSYKELGLHIIKKCDIVMMSNISDYIKGIYNTESDYVEKYIKDIMNNFKSENNKIVCAYLYDIENTKYRTEIDNPTIRKNIFNKLNITYVEKKFESVMDNCIDSVVIIY